MLNNVKSKRACAIELSELILRTDTTVMVINEVSVYLERQSCLSVLSHFAPSE